MIFSVITLLVFFFAKISSSQTLKFSEIIANGVLQRSVNTTIWGEGATPNTNVKITLHTSSPYVVVSSSDTFGKWSAQLPAQAASWNVKLSAVTHSDSAETVVSFGIVLLCAGQSNMDMPVACHLTNQSACNYPKRQFYADNGTAEVAAAGRYKNKIFMIKAVQSKYEKRIKPKWTTATTDYGPKAYPAAFSAVCWYTGKYLFQKLEGKIPIGLMLTSVGGSPIEYWLPPDSGINENACEVDIPQCDNQFNDSTFFTDIVEQFIPYTIGAIIWDQAERDVKCPTSLGAYDCMQRLLINSWRRRFNSSNVPFVAVQLPGYTGPLINGTGKYNTIISSEMVFHMRLQQAKGASFPTTNATYVVTYDLSCSSSQSCPYGSVHNVEKGPIGMRIANKLLNFFQRKNIVAEGPHVTSISPPRLVQHNQEIDTYEIVLKFAGGSQPFKLSGTKNCSTCCDGDGHTIDFDVSSGNYSMWFNSTKTVLSTSGEISFSVTLPKSMGPPTIVRHTAASIFPQCALRNAEGLPALPFQKQIPTI